MGLIIRLAAFVALIGALAYIGNTLGYRLDWFDLGTAFSHARLLAMPLLIAGAVTILLSLIGFFTKRAGSALFGLVAGVLALACGLGPVMMKHNAGKVPPIHDITTDTQNPPAFIAVVPLREAEGAPNPPGYDAGQTAQQLEAYPDLVTVTVSEPYGVAYDAALVVLGKMGMDVVAADREAGRIEASHTSLWWGFTDDVVIRFNREADPLTIDMRSKSRIGMSDVGANAARIEKFFDLLEKELDG